MESIRGACNFHPYGCPDLAHSPDADQVISDLLVKGAHMIEDSITHVTHGGPTVEDAQRWLDEVRKYVSLGTISVTVGTEAH